MKSSPDNPKAINGVLYFLLVGVSIVFFSAICTAGVIELLAQTSGIKDLGFIGNISLIPAGAVFGGFVGYKIASLFFK